MERKTGHVATTRCFGSWLRFAVELGPDQESAWDYPRPRPRFEMIKRYLAYYPGRVDCRLNGEPVTTQSGRFYGGWITSEVVGPFKGEPGTGHW